MKRTLILCLYFALFPSLLLSQTQDEKRRVEQEKRESLEATEVQIPTKEETALGLTSPLDTAYFIELLPRRITFRYDVCKVFVILMGVGEQYIDLDSQVTFLKEKNLLPKYFESEFDVMQPLRKGLIAYMFCNALKIKGGGFLRLFGRNERYALKELVFEGLMSPGNVNDIVSGEELISVFMQASAYMAKVHPVNTVKPIKNEK